MTPEQSLAYLAELVESVARAACEVGPHLTAGRRVDRSVIVHDRAAGIRWTFTALDIPSERGRAVWDVQLETWREVVVPGEVRVLDRIAARWMNREAPAVPVGLAGWRAAGELFGGFTAGLEAIACNAATVDTRETRA